jgi:hypothetical protein
MKSSFSPLVILAAFALSFTSGARAQVIYNNLGSSTTFPTASGFGIGFPSGSEVAVRFTAGSTLLLDYADLRLWNYGAATGTVAVLTNGADNRPATLLESVAVAFPAVAIDFSPLPLTRANFSDTLLLTAGTLYWLAVSPASASAMAGWDSTGLPFGTVVRDTGAIGAIDPWSTVVLGGREGGMRIVGVAPTPVPEPSTYGVIASVLLGGIAASRRWKRPAT